MALFGRDYDREYGTWGAGGRGYDRMTRPGRSYWDRSNAYMGYTRHEPDMWATSYDRDYGAGRYDRGYKSRWQTDHGDPFGDRTSRTPMRMIRGGFQGGYDRNYYGDQWGRGSYDRNYRGTTDYYETNPMSYDPYEGREGTWMRGRDRNYRSYGRGGYDTGWF